MPQMMGFIVRATYANNIFICEKVFVSAKAN